MLASKHLQRAKLCSQGESTLLRFGQDLLNVPAAKASRDIRRDLELITSIHIPLNYKFKLATLGFSSDELECQTVLSATDRVRLSLKSDLRLKRQICLQRKLELFLRTPERGSEHMKHKPLSANQQSIDVDAVPLGVEWSFVQNEHDMKHSSVANKVKVGSDKRPELEALRCLLIHLRGIANQG